MQATNTSPTDNMIAGLLAEGLLPYPMLPTVSDDGLTVALFVVALAWVLAEVVHFFAVRRRAKVMQKRVRAPDLGEAHRVRHFHRLIRMDIEETLRGWFFGAPVESIKLDTLRDFLSAMVFSLDWRDLTPAQQAECSRYIAFLELSLHHRFEPGVSPPSVRCARFTMEPLSYWHHPLAVHLTTRACPLAAAAVLRFSGFRRYKYDGFTYWVSAPAASELRGPDRYPILFMHGLGVGLLPYIMFVLRLAAGRQIIVPELPHLAVGVHRRVPDMASIVRMMCHVQDKHDGGAGKVALLGHSYGTLYASAFLQQHPERVACSVMMDPVCFLLCDCNIALNFLYRRPRTLFDVLRFAFVSKNLHMQYNLRRHLWWQECLLWFEDIPTTTPPRHAHAGAAAAGSGVPHRCLVQLSGGDTISPADVVQRHYEAQRARLKHVDLVRHEHFRHGQVLGSCAAQEAVAGWVRDALQEVDAWACSA